MSLFFVRGFFDTLWSYLRPKGEGKGYDDSRPQVVAQFATSDPVASIEFMKPGDFAAIFSGVMSGSCKPVVIESLAGLRPKDRERRLVLLLDAERTIAYTIDPARADVSNFVARLRAAEGGAAFLAKVAICLSEGSRDRRTKPFMFNRKES